MNLRWVNTVAAKLILDLLVSHVANIPVLDSKTDKKIFSVTLSISYAVLLSLEIAYAPFRALTNSLYVPRH